MNAHACRRAPSQPPRPPQRQTGEVGSIDPRQLARAGRPLSGQTKQRPANPRLRGSGLNAALRGGVRHPTRAVPSCSLPGSACARRSRLTVRTGVDPRSPVPLRPPANSSRRRSRHDGCRETPRPSPGRASGPPRRRAPPERHRGAPPRRRGRRPRAGHHTSPGLRSMPAPVRARSRRAPSTSAPEGVRDPSSAAARARATRHRFRSRRSSRAPSPLPAKSPATAAENDGRSEAARAERDAAPTRPPTQPRVAGPPRVGPARPSRASLRRGPAAGSPQRSASVAPAAAAEHEISPCTAVPRPQRCTLRRTRPRHRSGTASSQLCALYPSFPR